MDLHRLSNLYRDTILEHHRNPRNSVRLEHSDIEGEAVNPFCGDEIHIQVCMDQIGLVTDVGLQAEGCLINIASGSMLSEVIKDKTIDEIQVISNAFQHMMYGKYITEDETQQIVALQSMSGIRAFPIRIKCALLAWAGLDTGILEYQRCQQM